MTNSEIIEIVNKIPTCCATEKSANEIFVTYRAKKSDTLYINTQSREINYFGKTETLATQIANAINFTVDYNN